MRAMRVALVTGATDGIGAHTARQLALSDTKTHLLLHGRDPIRLTAARQAIIDQSPSAVVDTLCFDLSTMHGARGLADAVLARTDRIDIFVQNAGVFADTYITTADGLEQTFAINVVAPFILASRLYNVMRSTKESRMLMVSSISQESSRNHEKDFMERYSDKGYDRFAAYGASKLHMAMLSLEMASRIRADEVTVFSCDPGTVNTKMLLAGWGACGIEVSDANHEFELVQSFDSSMHGKYFVHNKIPSQCASDVYNKVKRSELWNALERLTEERFL